MKRKVNKKMNKTILGIIAVSLVALVAVSMVTAFGFGNGVMNSELTDEERAELQEQREAMRTAVEEGNYAEWEGLMQERIAAMESQITEENFEKLQLRHQQMSQLRDAVEEARETGDWSEVEALEEEFGTGGPGFRGMRKMHGPGFGDCPMADTE